MPTRHIDGHLVSESWYWVLSGARHSGVRFVLDSGRRTMGEQWQLYRHPPAGTPVVAFPSPWAPHIKLGREDHALDISTENEGNRDLAHWLEHEGCPVVFNVRGEPWHMEAISARKLKALAAHWKEKLTEAIEILWQHPQGPGSRSDIVHDMMVYLVRGGFLPHNYHIPHKPAIYPPSMKPHVQAFQSHVRLKADGVIGAKTFAAARRRWHFRRRGQR